MPAAQLKEYAWHFKNSGDVPHFVACLKVNAFGAHDMLGNVWEWVDDWYAADTYKNIITDPAGLDKGLIRVRHGGSYHFLIFQTRTIYRSANALEEAYSVIGFRVVAMPVVYMNKGGR